MDLRELLFNVLLAVIYFLAPPAYHLETPCYGIVSFFQRLLDFQPETSYAGFSVLG